MSDILKAAIITFMGTVICVPLVNLLMNYLSVKRARLLVKITAHKFHTNGELCEYIRKDIFKDGFDELRRNTLYALSNVEGYIEMILSNKSRRRLNSVSVTTDDYQAVCYQIGAEKACHLGEKGKRILVGDLQPGQSQTLHLWTQQDVSNRLFQEIIKNTTYLLMSWTKQFFELQCRII